MAPWSQDVQAAGITLNGISYLLQVASELYEPIIPDGAPKAIDALKNKEKVILYPKMK